MNTLKRLLPEGAFDLQSSPEKKIGPYISNLPSEYGSSSDDSTGTVSIPPKEYLSEPISELSVSTEPTTSDISSNQILSIKPDEVTLSSEEVSDWPGIEDVPEQKSEQSNKPLSSMIAETFFPPSAPHPTPIPSTTSSSDIDWSEFENSNQNDSSDSSDSSDSEGSWLAPVATAATMSSTGSSSENTSDFFHNLLNDKVHSHYTKKGHSKGSRVKKSIRLSYKRKHSPKRSYKNASKRKSSGKRKSASKRKSSKRSYKRYTKRSYKK